MIKNVVKDGRARKRSVLMWHVSGNNPSSRQIGSNSNPTRQRFPQPSSPSSLNPFFEKMPLFPRVEYEKNNGSKPVMIFLAGYPDNERSGWGTIVPEEMSKDYDLHFLCLPGYEKGGKVPGWGWNFDELVEFLHLTISQVNKDLPVVLVTHDWGAFLGLLYQTKYPQNVRKLILFDVGMLDVFTVSLKSMIYITMYQVWLALSFIVSRVAGVFAGTIFMAIFFLPIFRPLWPTTDVPPINRNEIRSDKCYTYFHLWKKLLTTLKVPKVKFPTMPTLYMVIFQFFH